MGVFSGTACVSLLKFTSLKHSVSIDQEDSKAPCNAFFTIVILNILQLTVLSEGRHSILLHAVRKQSASVLQKIQSFKIS